LANQAGVETRIVIADDDPIVREVLREMVSVREDMQVVAVAEDGNKAVEAVRSLRPDILLLDLLMPNLPGLDALRELVDTSSYTRTIILSSSVTNRQIVESLQLGARGILLKDSLTFLPQCIQQIMAGHYWVGNRVTPNIVQLLGELERQSPEPKPNTYGLTPRELDVVCLVAEGLPNRDIALRLIITEETVKRHLTNIFDKVGMSNRVELALFAINHHLVQN
jgi:DNA-binding NarL/FixJ family response regulator